MVLPSTQKLDTLVPDAGKRLAATPKVTPEVMMIVYLDEIAGRLAELQEQLAAVTSEGRLESYELNITGSPTRLPIYARHISIHNDGTNDVYILPERGTPISGSEAPIKKSGQVSLDLQTRRPRSFWLVCNSGETATVRIFTW